MSTSPNTTTKGQVPQAPAPAPSDVMRRRPSPDVEWVEVGGEIVAWNAVGESLHLLDPVAAIIFQLLDGITPLEVTSRELAEAFGRDLEQVRADVLGFAAALEGIGVVERVA